MKHSIKKGLSFGLSSGIITTLGLTVGLHSATRSGAVVIASIFVIAVADAMSDAFGMHMSEEAENKHTQKEIWESTLATFLSKFIFALTFIAPILFFELKTAIVVCILWGFLLITLFSYNIAMERNEKSHRIILEHLLIAIIVVVITHYIGDMVGKL